MPTYTQEGRPMRVDFEGLDDDVLLLRGFSGVEELSRPFAFEVDLLSEDDAISADDVLRKWIRISLVTPGGGVRHLHGVVNRFVQLEQRDDLTAYRATMVPWLWFLSLSHDCKVFQNLSVLEIAEEVFAGLGYTDYRLSCTGTYPPREYCVQYRESHLAFVSRLLEEEGVSFYFEHSDSAHEMVICDANEAFSPCPDQPEARMAQDVDEDEDSVMRLQHERVVGPGMVTLTNFDPLQPSLKLESSISGQDGEEIYDYPGIFVARDEGARYARVRLEAAELLERTVTGDSTCRGFCSGYRFELKDHYRPDLNQAYTLLRIAHQGTAGDYFAWDEAPATYHNAFVAAPHDVPFRPQRTTPRPVVRGTQTATVVGKAGEEVWVDDHGRIKIQFHWDRLGPRNEKSSCWVRVATPWGGKGWGSVSIPRIGNEVIVDFLEGDPDRPIIVGSVYNAEQSPPFVGIQMGMKSRSSKGGGGYNEITLADTKGDELITIHGQFDMDTAIEHDNRENVGNDETTGVGNDQSLSVGNDQSISIGNNRSEEVAANEDIAIGANRSETVGGNESIDVSGSRTRSVGVAENVAIAAAQAIEVGAAQSITVGGARSVSVGAIQSIDVGANQSIDVGANQSIDVGGNQTVGVGGNQAMTVGGAESRKVGKGRSTDVGEDEALKVGKNLVIDAGDSITIKTGKASISMKKDGTIVLSGKDITLKASGKMDVKASKDIVMKGKKILQN